MAAAGRIEVNPKVMLGKPVIRGTRIPVELILRKLSEGATEAELVDAYPKLTPEDIRAALAYAAGTGSGRPFPHANPVTAEPLPPRAIRRSSRRPVRGYRAEDWPYAPEADCRKDWDDAGE